MPENVGVVVTGIPELMRALRDTDRDLQKATRKEFRGIAEHVVGLARSRMEFGGAAAQSVKAGAGIRGAWIRYPAGGKGSGDDPAGHFPWLDYGGGKVTGRGVRPSGSRRPVRAKGRYVYPAIGESRGFIETEVYRIIEGVAKRNKFDTEGF